MEKRKFTKGERVFYIQPTKDDTIHCEDWRVFKGFVISAYRNYEGDDCLDVAESRRAKGERVLSIYAEFGFKAKDEARKVADEINGKNKR